MTTEEIREQVAGLAKNDIYCAAGDIVDVLVEAGRVDPCNTIPHELSPCCCSDNWSYSSDESGYICNECGELFDELYTREVCEWWLVSDFLATYLERIGAVVVRSDSLPPVWGRVETGQSLQYDSELRACAICILSDVKKIVEGLKK